MRELTHIKRIRLHHEGRGTLIYGGLALLAVNVALFFALRGVTLIPFYVVAALSVVTYGIVVNFFRCPIRIFKGAPELTVVAAADGRVVVVEEVEENEVFHDRRIMVSIFMSLWNVHANWYPVEGFVKRVEHQSGNYHKAYLPKASLENERSLVLIETPAGQEVLVRQVAGAVARRIVVYAAEGDECYIDEHMGFIKFGSRVDVYLPLGTEICVHVGQSVTGNQTVVGRLQP